MASQTLVESALRAQFEVLGTIFDAMSVIVYVADLDTHEMLFANAYTAERFGRDWRGRRCFEFLQQGQAGPCAFCTNPHLLVEGQPAPPWIWEFRNTVNGRWYLCVDRAIPWVDGRLVRLEVAVDITARKEVDALREQYTGLLSHDLKNALNGIVLNLALLERRLKAAGHAEDLDAARRVDGYARRMGTMLDELLETLRLEAPTFELKRTPTDLGEVARRVVSLLAPALQQRVLVHTAASGPHVSGDGSRLERVLDNLLSNALKHSASDAPIVVEVSEDGEVAALSVSDQGRGIPPEQLPHLFQRFYRPPGTTADGLGLGLYIARLIVEHHGGLIHVESEVGRGACFRFTIPLGNAR